MTDITTTVIPKFSANKLGGAKVIEVVTPATAVSTDTFNLLLSDFAASTVVYALGFTSDGSIVVLEQPSTAVSNGVLTVTIGGTAVTSMRTILIGVQ